MEKIESFIEFKSQQIEKLVKAIFEKEVDLEIIPYLSEINHLQNFVTLWSCIGHPTDPRAYITFSSALSPEIVIEGYKPFAMEVFAKKAVLSKVSPYHIEISYSEEGFVKYTFRLGIHVHGYNRVSVEDHLSKVIEFLKSIDNSRVTP